MKNWKHLNSFTPKRILLYIRWHALFCMIMLLWNFRLTGGIPAAHTDYYADPNENDVMMERFAGNDAQEDYYDNIDSSGSMGELPEDIVEEGSEVEPDVIDPSLPAAYVEWCEAGQRRKVFSSQCMEITFVPPFPSCFCFEGIVSFQMDETRDCETTLHFGKGACFKFETFGRGARSIRFVRRNGFKLADFMVATKLRKGDTKWKLTSLEQNSSVVVSGQAHFLNGILYQDGKGCNCIQKVKPENCGKVYAYKHIFGEFNVSSGGPCPGVSIADSRFVQEILATDSQCSLTCPSKPENETNPGLDDRSQIDPIPFETITETLDSCQPISSSLKSLHADLNTRILKRSIDESFKDADSDQTEFKPARSFRLLKQMADITGKVCEKAGIGDNLLLNAVDLLQIAHQGRGYYFPEDFAEDDYQHISKVLTNCFDDVWPIRFRCDTCGGEIKEVFNVTSYKPLTISREDYFDHHVALDIPWAIVNLATVVCVDYFHHSYRMYHLLEQGMEKLFTKELRTFWLYPEYPRNLYERLFGPFWALHVKNLQLCVEGAYLTSEKRMYPLERPTWLPGSATRTKAQKVCRRRRTHESSKILSSTYEIYCDTLQCR